jgi:O-antigen/teichoic acid export membrane protein
MKERLAVLGGTLISTGGNLAEYAVGLLVSIVIARTLGPDDFGVFSYAVWLCGVMFFFANHGVPLTTIRFTADARGRGDLVTARAIGERLSRVQWVSLLLVVLGFLAVSWLIKPDYWDATAPVFVVLIIVSVVAKSRYGFLVSVALGHQRYMFSALAPVASAVAYLLVSLVVQRSAPSPTMFLGAYALSTVTGFAVLAILLSRDGLSVKRAPVPDELRRRVRDNLGMTAVLALLALAANRTIETFALSYIGTASEIGFFAIAGTLTKGAVDILTAGMQATLMPVMAHASAKRGTAQLGPMFNTALRYYWFIGLVIAGAGALLARPLVLLVYGNPYAPAILPVQLTIVGAGLSIVGSVIGAFLTTQDRQEDRVRAAAWALIANAVIAAVLVPGFGLIGASVTFALVRIASTALALRYFLRAAMLSIEFAPLHRMAWAWVAGLAVAAAPFVMLPQRWGGAVAASLLLAVGIPMTVLMRCWYRADYDLFLAVVEKLGVRSQRLMRTVAATRGRFAADARA